jgi:hypothetical protein
MAIEFHVYDSWNITKQNKIERKCNANLLKNSFFIYGNVFFFKK